MVRRLAPGGCASIVLASHNTTDTHKFGSRLRAHRSFSFPSSPSPPSFISESVASSGTAGGVGDGERTSGDDGEGGGDCCGDSPGGAAMAETWMLAGVTFGSTGAIATDTGPGSLSKDATLAESTSSPVLPAVPAAVTTLTSALSASSRIPVSVALPAGSMGLAAMASLNASAVGIVDDSAAAADRRRSTVTTISVLDPCRRRLEAG